MSKSSDRRQARREAALQYNPQIDALTSILGGLKTDTRGAVKQARTGARITARSAKNALPEAKKIYRDALAGNTPGQKLIASEAAKLDASSPFAAAINIETGGATTRMQAAKARTLSELVSRGVDAVSGGQQEVRSIRQGYQADKAKTLDQLLSVTKSKGLYASTRYGSLRGDAAGRAVTKRGQDLTAGNSKQSSNDKYLTKYGMSRKDFLALPTVQRQALIDKANAPKTKPKKPAMATPTQQAAAQDNIKTARTAANKLKATGLSRHKAAAVMTDPEAAKEFGIKVPGPFWASVGLDLAYDGHISHANAKELHDNRKVRVHKLGFPLKAPPKKKPKTVQLTAGINVPTTFPGA